MQRRVARYSVAFKKEVVRELEMGQFRDPSHASFLSLLELRTFQCQTRLA